MAFKTASYETMGRGTVQGVVIKGFFGIDSMTGDNIITFLPTGHKVGQFKSQRQATFFAREISKLNVWSKVAETKNAYHFTELDHRYIQALRHAAENRLYHLTVEAMTI